MVSVLPPHVVHDGRPATSRGYRKRVLYVEPDVLGEELIGRAVDEPFVEDAALRRRLDLLHARLRHPDDAFEAEAHLALVAERLRAHLRAHTVEENSGRASELAERLRCLLDDHTFEAVTLAAAGTLLAASPAQLVRSFSRSFGVAPHAYLLGRRIEAARQRLLEGEPVARVAAHVGFSDQAHLTRHFKRHVGTTPGSVCGRRGG